MVTLQDIAEQAGVSIATVSVILNDRGKELRISGETIAKVLSQAKKLGYRRNELAATIRTGINRTVAVIGSFSAIGKDDSYNTVMAGILVEATKLKHGVKIFSDGNLQDCVREILGSQIKYVISMSVDHKRRETTAELCRAQQLKLVYTYEKAHDEFPSVTAADRDRAREATLFLVKAGHRRIALICGPHRFAFSTERHAGYLEGLAEAGIKVDRSLLCCKEKYDVIEATIDTMLKMPPDRRPTAFLGTSDSDAMLVQQRALRRGLRVPEEVSVIGFGDSMAGRFAVSPLCSVAQPFSEIGRTAVKLLLQGKCEIPPSAEGNYFLPGGLVIRESVVPPNSPHTQMQ